MERQRKGLNTSTDGMLQLAPEEEAGEGKVVAFADILKPLSLGGEGESLRLNVKSLGKPTSSAAPAAAAPSGSGGGFLKPPPRAGPAVGSDLASPPTRSVAATTTVPSAPAPPEDDDWGDFQAST